MVYSIVGEMRQNVRLETFTPSGILVRRDELPIRKGAYGGAECRLLPCGDHSLLLVLRIDTKSFAGRAGWGIYLIEFTDPE